MILLVLVPQKKRCVLVLYVYFTSRGSFWGPKYKEYDVGISRYRAESHSWLQSLLSGPWKITYHMTFSNLTTRGITFPRRITQQKHHPQLPLGSWSWCLPSCPLVRWREVTQLSVLCKGKLFARGKTLILTRGLSFHLKNLFIVISNPLPLIHFLLKIELLPVK